MKKNIEIILLVAILLVALGLRYVNPYFLADLPIVPDSAQYAIGGYSIARGEGFCVFINDIRLPPLYPPGLPLILAAFYRLTGGALHTAIYVILASALLSIALCYLFARSVFGPPTALLAALLLAVSPLYVGYSQVLISDMVSNIFIVAGLWLAWQAAARGKSAARLLFLAGISCGFSAAVHLLSGITVIPLAAACLFASRGRFGAAASSLSSAAAGFVIGLSPLLLHNYLTFGGVFASGYSYWSRWGGSQRSFAFSYALRNTGVPEAGVPKGNIIYYMWHFLGLSWPTLFAPYFPSVLLLAIYGAYSSLKGRDREARGRSCFTLICVFFIISLTAALFFYSYQMAKFFLPVVPFVCILAACGLIALLRGCRGSAPRSRIMRIPVALLLLVTAWGCWKPYAGGQFQRHAPTWWHEGLSALDRLAPGDAHLVSGIDGVYVTHYFVKDTERNYIPISREVEYLKQRDLPLKVAVEDTEYLKGLLLQGKKVYMDGFTFDWWGRDRALLAGDFAFVPVMQYYGGNLFIYELALRDND